MENTVTSNPIAFEYKEDSNTEKKEKSFGIKDLPQLLRYLGATILFASAASFLLQGWGGWDSIHRYGYFLLFTLSLSACGFGLGIKLRDDKGARTLLAIGAAFLPAHATQLGAMLYANFAGKADFGRNLSYLSFDPVPAFSLAIVILVATLLLIPVAYSGISAMARAEAKKITAIYLASNMLLLLPVRDGSLVAIASALALSTIFFLDRKIFKGETSMETWEAGAMRILPAVPVGVALIRNLLLYPHTETITALVLLLLSATLVGIGSLVKRDETGKFIQFWASFPTIGAAQYLTAEIAGKFYLDYSLESMLAGYLTAAGLVVLGFYSRGTGKNYNRFAALIALAAGFEAMVRYQSPFVSSTSIELLLVTVIGLINALLTTIVGFQLRDKFIFRLGIVALIGTLIYQVNFSFIFAWISPWMALAAIGLTTVFASSILETKASFGKEKLRRLRERFANN